MSGARLPERRVVTIVLELNVNRELPSWLDAPEGVEPMTDDDMRVMVESELIGAVWGYGEYGQGVSVRDVRSVVIEP
jgi:hypothetical protein